MIEAIVIACTAAATASLCAYHLRKLRIAEFARHVTRGSQSQHEATLALARAIFSEVKRGRDPAFLLPLLASLGGSPPTILKAGGCCSGVHRLFITALDTLGIRAAQVTVYRREDPAAAHCLAQVRTESANMLIDVDYGVCLQHPDGGPIDLAGLRSGVRPAIHPFVFDRQASYADGSFDDGNKRVDVGKLDMGKRYCGGDDNEQDNKAPIAILRCRLLAGMAAITVERS